MKKSIWCKVFGCRLIIVRAVFPYNDEWFVRCKRHNCNLRTITIIGNPWPIDDNNAPWIEDKKNNIVGMYT